MPSIIEIILSASDQTGPAFASARANLQGLAAASRQAAQATRTATASNQLTAGSVAMVQGNQAAAQSLTGVAAASQQVTQATQQQTSVQTQQAAAARQLAAVQAQNARLTRDIALASTDAAGKVRIWRQEEQRLETQLRQTTGDLMAQTRAENELLSVRRRRITAENVQQRGLGPALPRTFAGFTQSGAMQAAGALGIATAGPELIAQLNQMASAGQNVQVSLDGTRASLGALLSDQQKGNDIFERGIAAGRALGETQQSSAEALRASSQIIRTSQEPIENIVNVLARMQILSPEQTLAEASLALRELSSGETESLVQRFEVTRSSANKMKAEIQGGADAVQVLGRYLESIGVDQRALAARTAGAAGEQRRYNQAIEELQVELNNVARASGVRSFLPDLFGNTAAEIRNIRTELAALPAAFQNLIPAPVIQALQFVDRLEDRLSGQLRQSKDRVAAALGTGGPGGSGFGFAGAAADAPVTPPPQVAPRRTGPYANTMLRTAGGVTMTPQAQGAVINNYTTNLTVQGSLVHTNDVIDTVNAGQAQQAQRTGSTRRR